MRRHSTTCSKAFVSLALLGGALLGADIVSAQQITLASSASDGTPASNGAQSPSISADGRFVAFVSWADNLVPGDTNGSGDVFVKDRLTGATTRVSVTSAGAEAPQPDPTFARISGDGRFVMFSTKAALVPEDTNDCGFRPVVPCQDVYVHDRQTGATTRVNVSSAGTEANDTNWAIDISADGRFVFFSSDATNLVPNDTNVRPDLFVRDRQLGTTTRVSVNPSGDQWPTFPTAARMSADGRFIVFSQAEGAEIASPVYLYERETGAVSVLSNGFPPGNLGSEFRPPVYTPTFISDNGRFVAVLEQAYPRPGSLLPLLGRNLLHDWQTGHTIASAWYAKGTFEARELNGLSGDGRTYAVTGRNIPTVLIDRVNGLQETVTASMSDPFQPVALSANGRFTAFLAVPSGGTNLQVQVYDRDSGDGDGMPSVWETTFGLNPNNLTDANADADSDGLTNLQEYLAGSHPTAVPAFTRYFAEGAANAFFTTRLAAVNPGDTNALAVFRFLGSGGQTSSVMRTIAARSRITLELPANGPTPGNDFSTVIESDRTIVVDRTMTWDSTGYGAHSETALTAPSTTWHLAEGATHGAFDLFYLLQNPNDTTAHTTIEYLRQAPLTPVTKAYDLPPNSRTTIPVDGEGPELAAVDVAAAITSDLPIVVERAMYSTRPGQPAFAAGHGAAGVTAPALRWFLAEGATGNFFDLYVLVSNPNATASDLKVTYLLPNGQQPFEKIYQVGSKQRLTIYVQDQDARLANTPVSVIVESTNNQPVVVERAMWWPKDQWYEAHVSAGATTTGTRWALADGEITTGGDTYILIANTSTTAGTATVTLLEEGGNSLPIIVDLPPSSRVNVPVSAHLAPTDSNPRRRFGALIESTGVEIVVERAIYTTTGGITWSAGTASLGTKLQ